MDLWRLANIAGLVLILVAFPLGVAFVLNRKGRRDWAAACFVSTFVLMGPIVALAALFFETGPAGGVSRMFWFLVWCLIDGGDRKGQPLVGTYLYWRALDRGDMAGVERALRPGLGGLRKPACLNGRGPGGGRALGVAIDHGDTKMALYLISRGANVSGLLNSAASHGLVAVVAALLEKGEDASSAMTVAVRGGQTEVVDLLIRHGVDVQGSEQYGWPLIEAAAEGNLGVVEALLSAGADVNAATTVSEGLFPSPLGRTALIAAVSHGHVHEGVVSQLIKAGADVNAADVRGYTALHEAALRADVRQTGIVRMLLAAGAKVDARTKAGETALFLAASASDASGLEIVQMLLKAGADAATRNSSGQWAYSRATGYSSQKIASALAAAGGRPNVYRGGMGEPYCSTCRSVADRRLGGGTPYNPTCGTCGKPSGGGFAMVPFETGVLIVCKNCQNAFQAKMRGEWRCVICGAYA